MIARFLENQILERIQQSSKIVLLYGSRQVGKTTLIEGLLKKLSYKTLHINADNQAFADVLSSRDSGKLRRLVGGYELVFIDEAQRISDIGINLKIIHDQIPEVKVVATGSSSFELANIVREPLTGRTWTFTLFPISLGELSAKNNLFELDQRLEEFLLFGMYPEVFSYPGAMDKVSFLKELSGAYLYKDILELGDVRHSRKVHDLLRLLAYQIGSTVSINELGRQLEMSKETVARYIDFQQLHLIDEQLNLAEVKARRQAQLLGIYERVQPDAIVIELYPFGRRMFDFELLPLLDRIQASTPSPKVICSLRDILVARKNQTKFDNEACALMNQYFDLLLVHADPNLQRLEETFPRVKDLQCDVRYTGFVVQGLVSKQQAADRRQQTEEKRILVSIGGGRIGHELIECAIAASALLNTPHSLHILTGPHCPDEIYAQLQQQIAARPHLTMERFTPDLPAYLQQADLSLSMAGYNTCMDIVSAGIRAIVYPFTGSDNQEQMMRARKLERLGAMTVLTPEQLTPEQLAHLLQQALQAPPVAAPIPLDLQGATKTAQALTELLQA